MQQPFVPQPKWIFLLLLLSCFTASAQPDFTLPLQKPEKYRNTELGAEKTDRKKFTLPRKTMQGMITHYNYYYNANRKIEEILERAKMGHVDNYTELLPFYNFSTVVTERDSLELDSVMYKATAGIVLHDLRNSYIDNLYLLIGKSYFYWRKFDSAYRMFQFINYNFFPKAKDEYIIVVGSNDYATKGDLNIATKEKKGIVHKAFSQPPSRNEALLWLAKTYAEDSLYAEALSITNLLRKDILFPARLHSQLDEVKAYVFYQQEQWDSTAYFLQKALVHTSNKSELARWEYLLGQLYSKLNKPTLAASYFNKAKAHTTDPVLYIHARIYEAQIVRTENNTSVQDALNDLVKLSKKERFDGFEDVLFFAASGMALQQKDTVLAKSLLQKSVQYNFENPSLKNKAFLKLATLAYHQKDYASASAYYDSLDVQDITLLTQAKEIEFRKTVLQELVKNSTIVKHQDSLQAVAKMPEKEMNAYLKAFVKKLRKQQGLKEEEPNINPAIGLPGLKEDAPLFTGGGTGNNWYFNSSNQKAKGYGEFLAIWGKRPNIDNWRRQSAVDIAIVQPTTNESPKDGSTGSTTNAIGDGELTVAGLKKNLPVTEEQIKESNKAILDALFTQGQIYKNQIEDYQQAALVFEEIIKRFSNFDQEEETLFELYYCNKKAGNIEKSNYFQSLLKQKYAGGTFETKINTSKNPKPSEKDAKTITYEKVYNLFIEGNFEQALQEKKMAHSIYKNTYWTPQLLYIEALYYIKQKKDSSALLTLTDIETTFPGTPMAEKAAILKDVVSRRSEIEDYLTNTNIVRQTEDAVVIPFDEGPKVNKMEQQVQRDSAKISIVNKPTQNNTNIEKPKAPVEKVGIEKNNKPSAKISLGNKPGTDSTRIKPLKDTKIEMAYLYNANEPYVVMMYFEKVDPIYITESRIAFQRYNNSSHTGETIQITIFEGKEDEMSWMDLGPYASVTSALGYYDELKTNARQIVPWLPADKYGFIVISQSNLEIFKTRKNFIEYKLFIGQYIKNKF